jgi:hypothetical protein
MRWHRIGRPLCHLSDASRPHGKPAVIALLHAEPAFSELFLRHLLARNIRIEEDLVDQLFNSSEKRLARVLLLLANFGKASKLEPAIPKVSQELWPRSSALPAPESAFS